jgi:hypothetical protein
MQQKHKMLTTQIFLLLSMIFKPTNFKNLCIYVVYAY